VLLDELSYLMPAGEIVPVSVGSPRIVLLAHKGATDIIDSCTYPGASQWQPSTDTPRSRDGSADRHPALCSASRCWRGQRACGDQW
jgi:hypothetical protein